MRKGASFPMPLKVFFELETMSRIFRARSSGKSLSAATITFVIGRAASIVLGIEVS